MIVLLPLADFPMNTVSGLISLIFTSLSGPKFLMIIDSFMIVKLFSDRQRQWKSKGSMNEKTVFLFCFRTESYL